MKILHLSDLHGRHTQAVEKLIVDHTPDWIVLTGDILPEFGKVSGEASRLARQREWWGTYRTSFMSPQAVTTFTLGNHEIFGFRDRELEAVPSALVGLVGILQGNPTEFGSWGFSREYGPEQLQAEVGLLNHPQVVLSHCPPYGLADRNRQGVAIGHRPLRALLDNSLEAPALVLCGHVHEGNSQIHHGGTLVVNSAGGYALLDLDLGTGQVKVLEMNLLSSTHQEAQ